MARGHVITGNALFTGAREVLTCQNATAASVRSGVALAVQNGVIRAIADEPTLRARFPELPVVGCDGVLTPGFVDSHTHAVFGGWRAAEYALRSQGVPYMEIARRGGGIHASVRDLRTRTEDELVALTRPRLQRMLRLGTTTAEVKSGYGLETESELRMLRVIRRLDAEGPLDLVPTFMGAHEVPADFVGGADAYADHVVREMIPAVAAEGLARFCDVFMEPGVFNAAQTRHILEAGSAHDLLPRLHADELENSSAAELAVSVRAASADHLGAVSEQGIAALASSETVATLLPMTLLFLGRNRFAPARRLRDAGATIALATDFNPGSAPSPSMPMVLMLACSQMGLDPLAAIQAATAGGARALRLEDGRGMLTEGAPADLVLWAVEDHREIPYQFGYPPIAGVWKRGVQVAGRL